MQQVPLASSKDQILQIILGNQTCQMRVYQRALGLFVDLYVNNQLIKAGCIAQDRNRLIREPYLGFSGDLVFRDTQGTSDPTVIGLGSRYLLYYLSVDDVTALDAFLKAA